MCEHFLHGLAMEFKSLYLQGHTITLIMLNNVSFFRAFKSRNELYEKCISYENGENLRKKERRREREREREGWKMSNIRDFLKI